VSFLKKCFSKAGKGKNCIVNESTFWVWLRSYVNEECIIPIQFDVKVGQIALTKKKIWSDLPERSPWSGFLTARDIDYIENSGIGSIIQWSKMEIVLMEFQSEQHHLWAKLLINLGGTSSGDVMKDGDIHSKKWSSADGDPTETGTNEWEDHQRSNS